MLFIAPTAVAPNMAPLGSLEMVAWLMFGELTVDNPSYTKRPVSCDAPLQESYVSAGPLCHQQVDLRFLGQPEVKSKPLVFFFFFFFLEVVCIDVIPGQLASITALLAYSNTVFINCELVVLHVFETTVSNT